MNISFPQTSFPQTVADDETTLVEEAASRVINSAKVAIEKHGRFTLGFAGGSTPRALYEALATPRWSKAIDWTKVYAFMGDERCVPIGHAESNWKMVSESLLDRVPIPAHHQFPVQTKLTPEEAAPHYSKLLQEHAPEGLDLVLLGMGPDGHTASLFPAEPAPHDTALGAISTYVSHLESWRVTLTLPELCRAKEILFLVKGKSKAPVLDEIRRGDSGLPAERVTQAHRPHGSIHWVVDSSAATLDTFTALKRDAAEKAVEGVRSGMKVGLGTGSTARFVTTAIGRLLQQGQLNDLQCVPTSIATAQLARERGVPLVRLADVDGLDVTIDGADEVSPELDVIKGLGGAHVREKIIAHASKKLWIVADDSKKVARIGEKAPVPIAVLPFEWETHRDFLETLGGRPVLRMNGERPLVTDDGCYILDSYHEGGISDPRDFHQKVKSRTGIVETGLFLGDAEKAFLAGQTEVEVMERS